jgi:hypothetical protein
MRFCVRDAADSTDGTRDFRSASVDYIPRWTFSKNSPFSPTPPNTTLRAPAMAASAKLGATAKAWAPRAFSRIAIREDARHDPSVGAAAPAVRRGVRAGVPETGCRPAQDFRAACCVGRQIPSPAIRAWNSAPMPGAPEPELWLPGMARPEHARHANASTRTGSPDQYEDMLQILSARNRSWASLGGSGCLGGGCSPRARRIRIHRRPSVCG